MISEWLSRRFWGTRSNPIPVQILHMKRNQQSDSVIRDVAEIDEKLTVMPSGLPQNSKVLIVNDMIRGGFTLKAAKEFLSKHFSNENIGSASLICHENASFKPTGYVAMTKKVVRFDWKSYS